MDTKRYIISDAAKMVDVEAHVLRYWEDELELPIARNEMGHRYYTEDNIRMFHHIKELKEQGYQLKAIKVLLPEVEQGKTPPAIVQQPDPPVSDRMEQFQKNGICIFLYRYHFYFLLNYSAEIAPVGHSASQVPHSRQASASITYFPSPSEIASAGQTAAQEPQATHSSEITYAIIQILLV